MKIYEYYLCDRCEADETEYMITMESKYCTPVIIIS